MATAGNEQGPHRAKGGRTAGMGHRGPSSVLTPKPTDTSQTQLQGKLKPPRRRRRTGQAGSPCEPSKGKSLSQLDRNPELKRKLLNPITQDFPNVCVVRAKQNLQGQRQMVLRSVMTSKGQDNSQDKGQIPSKTCRWTLDSLIINKCRLEAGHTWTRAGQHM